MTYKLIIGDKTFSSWSLRGWLLLETFGLPYREHLTGLYSGTYKQDLAPFAPARTVPTMVTPEGFVLTDSLAIAEELAQRHPDADLWPADPAARALARSITAEMHSGFATLRGECPMMLAHRWADFPVSDTLAADVARVEELWSLARTRHGSTGPYLFGEWSIADCFYAPVAMRFVTYGLGQRDGTQAYVAAIVTHPAIQRWRAEGLEASYDPMPYDLDLKKLPWPGDAN